jgi:hypothetical protein
VWGRRVAPRYLRRGVGRPLSLDGSPGCEPALGARRSARRSGQHPEAEPRGEGAAFGTYTPIDSRFSASAATVDPDLSVVDTRAPSGFIYRPEQDLHAPPFWGVCDHGRLLVLAISPPNGTEHRKHKPALCGDLPIDEEADCELRRRSPLPRRNGDPKRGRRRRAHRENRDNHTDKAETTHFGPISPYDFPPALGVCEAKAFTPLMAHSWPKRPRSRPWRKAAQPPSRRRKPRSEATSRHLRRPLATRLRSLGDKRSPVQIRAPR